MWKTKTRGQKLDRIILLHYTSLKHHKNHPSCICSLYFMIIYSTLQYALLQSKQTHSCRHKISTTEGISHMWIFELWSLLNHMLWRSIKQIACDETHWKKNLWQQNAIYVEQCQAMGRCNSPQFRCQSHTPPPHARHSGAMEPDKMQANPQSSVYSLLDLWQLDTAAHLVSTLHFIRMKMQTESKLEETRIFFFFSCMCTCPEIHEAHPRGSSWH